MSVQQDPGGGLARPPDKDDNTPYQLVENRKQKRARLNAAKGDISHQSNIVQAAPSAGNGDSSYQTQSNGTSAAAVTLTNTAASIVAVNTAPAAAHATVVAHVAAAAVINATVPTTAAVRIEQAKERPFRDYELAKYIPVWETERDKLVDVTLTLQYSDIRSIKPSSEHHAYARDFLRVLGAINNFHATDSTLTAEQIRLRAAIRGTQKGYTSYPQPAALKSYKEKFQTNSAAAPPITVRLQLTYNDAETAAEARDVLSSFGSKVTRVDRGTPLIISGKIAGIKNAHLLPQGDTGFLAAQYAQSVIRALAVKHIVDHVGLTHHSMMYFVILASDFNQLVTGHGQFDIYQSMMPKVKLCTGCGSQAHGTRACTQPLCHICGHARHGNSLCTQPILDHCVLCKHLPVGTAHTTRHLTKNCPLARGYYTKHVTPAKPATAAGLNAPIIIAGDSSLPAWRGLRLAATSPQSLEESETIAGLRQRIIDLEKERASDAAERAEMRAQNEDMSTRMEAMSSTISNCECTIRGQTAMIEELAKTINKFILHSIEAMSTQATTATKTPKKPANSRAATAAESAKPKKQKTAHKPAIAADGDDEELTQTQRVAVISDDELDYQHTNRHRVETRHPNCRRSDPHHTDAKHTIKYCDKSTNHPTTAQTLTATARAGDEKHRAERNHFTHQS
jgi:hypothetical protein